MDKKLIIINGTMGVGKTTLCKALYQQIEKSVWLDGDWCWMMHPWTFTEENKRMVVDNITYLLRNFLKNSSFDYIVFDWVIHQEAIFDMLLNKLEGLNFQLHKITLTCSEKMLKSRMIKDGRDPKVIDTSIRRLKLYDALDTIKIDTTNLPVSDVVQAVLKIVK